MIILFSSLIRPALLGKELVSQMMQSGTHVEAQGWLPLQGLFEVELHVRTQANRFLFQKKISILIKLIDNGLPQFVYLLVNFLMSLCKTIYQPYKHKVIFCRGNKIGIIVPSCFLFILELFNPCQFLRMALEDIWSKPGQ